MDKRQNETVNVPFPPPSFTQVSQKPGQNLGKHMPLAARNHPESPETKHPQVFISWGKLGDSTANLGEYQKLQVLCQIKNSRNVACYSHLPGCSTTVPFPFHKNCKTKLATPISNGGLFITPPGSVAGSARGGFANTISTGCLRWRLFYLLPPSNLSFSSCSRI